MSLYENTLFFILTDGQVSAIRLQKIRYDLSNRYQLKTGLTTSSNLRVVEIASL